MKLYLALAAVAAAALSAPSFAETSSWYAGVAAGASRTDINKNSLNATGVATNNVSTDETDTAYKLFAGYTFNKNFAVEGGWADLGKFSFNNTTTGPAGTASGTLKANGWFVTAIGILPLNEQFSLFGKLGAINSTVKSQASTTGGLTFVGGGNSFSSKKSDWSATYGIGAQYNITKAVAVRAEWERFDSLNGGDNIGKGDVDLLSIGLTFKF